MANFGRVVREKRLELDISLREMAQSLGVSAAYLSDIERGHRSAPLKHLPVLAVKLQMPLERLEYLAAHSRPVIFNPDDEHFEVAAMLARKVETGASQDLIAAIRRLLEE